MYVFYAHINITININLNIYIYIYIYIEAYLLKSRLTWLLVGGNGGVGDVDSGGFLFVID